MSRSRLLWCATALCFVLAGYIPARLAIAAQQAPDPELILMLGGSPSREAFTAAFAKRHPTLPIWVSSGQPTAAQTFHQAGIPAQRVILDKRARDTVTNFTSVADDLESRGVRHIYLVTSEFHMPRSQAIAAVVLGSRGIAFTPVSVPSTEPREARWRTLRDVSRSMVWLMTGRTGASLKPRS